MASLEGGTQAHLSLHKCVLIMHISLILPLVTFLISHFNCLICIYLALKKRHCNARFNGCGNKIIIIIQQSLVISADTKNHDDTKPSIFCKKDYRGMDGKVSENPTDYAIVYFGTSCIQIVMSSCSKI